MTLTKSLLLGSAAALVAAVSAQAADLPSKKAAPAQYVKICDAAGAGYFYIPGSDTCLKIGGYAELDIVAFGKPDSVAAASRGNPSFATDTEIQLDAVTKTSYGDIHTYLAYEMTTSTSPVAYIDNAYFEFAGLTAGKHESFYHNVGGLYSGYQTPDYSTNMLAYTVSAGGGFTATISIEDPTVSDKGAETLLGSRTPDVVGALRVKQGWGEASLIGGTHESRTSTATTNGYGVMGYLSFNIPQLAGDSVFIQAAYEKDALAFGPGGLSSYDSTITDVGQHAYSLVGGAVHSWSPTVSTTLEASYTNLTVKDGSGTSYKQTGVGQVTKWKPVKGLEFGIDTAYYRYQPVGGTDTSDTRFQFRAIRSF